MAMHSPDWRPPTDVVDKLGGRLDRISCGDQPWLAANDHRGPRIESDWLPFIPGTRTPYLCESFQLPPFSAEFCGPVGIHGHPLFLPGGPIFAVTLSDDGRLLAAMSEHERGRQRIAIWDMISGRRVRDLESSAGASPQFLPRHRLLMHDFARITIVDLVTERIEAEWDAATPEPQIFVAPNRRRVMVIAAETVAVFDCTLGLRLLADFPLPDGTYLGAFATNAIAINCNSTGTEIIRAWRLHETTAGVRVEPAGEWALTGGQVGAFAIAPAGDGVVVAPARRAELQVWNLPTCELAATIRIGKPASAVAFSPNGQWLVCGHEFVAVWAWPSRKPHKIEPCRLSVSAIGFSLTGDLMAVADREWGTISLLDVAVGQWR